MSERKKIQVERIITKWKCFIKYLIDQEKDDYALRVTSALATFLYEWNQSFVDDEIENYLDIVSRRNLSSNFTKSQCAHKTVLYYDSFGFDNRGLTIIYLKSLCEVGYKVIYISPEGQNQPILETATQGCNIKWKFVPKINTIEKAHRIIDLFNEYKPQYAFLYSLPGDTAAIAAFNVFKNIVTRFQINLTDHAFWLGINAFDYCIEFRNFGATVSHKYRNVEETRIILLPYYPYIDKTIPFEGFNPKFNGKKVVFSGGSVKKTLGDKNLLYYKLVKRILTDNEDVAFLYAGTGPDTIEIDNLILQFNTRAERISERKDLYQVLKHCVFFLNTYPDNGGLMTQYSAVAGKLPITLCEGKRDLSGLIFNRDKLKVEFNDIDLLAKEVNLILSDDLYRKKKESYLVNSVISEELFSKELKRLIEFHKTEFELSTNDSTDISEMRNEYMRSFNLQEQLFIAISSYRIMARLFPLCFIKLCIRKIIKILK